MSYRVHRVTADDWRRIKTLRLAALADTPIAFVERYEDAAQAPDTEWQFRAERAARATNLQVLAVADDGEWVGMMSAFVVVGTPWFMPPRERSWSNGSARSTGAFS